MINFDSKNNIYKSSLLDSIPHGFGTKQFGDGRNQRYLEQYLNQSHIQYEKIVVPHQTHSDKVVIICRDVINHVSTIEPCDGLVTSKKDTVLTVVTADCVPIIYADIESTVVAISHQGWKGTLNKLPEIIIQKMIEAGAKKESIICVFGPAINGCCYEIFGDRLVKFIDSFGKKVVTQNGNKQYLNLYKINRDVLLENGIQPDHIDIFPFCTSCNSEQFYSFHREKKINGEMISFVSIRNAAICDRK